MQYFLARILASLARRTLAKYRPLCVGVTGSVGKSSTKGAIALVLRAKYRVGASKKNYNNELGLPLAILGEEAHGKNVVAWIGVMTRAVWRLVRHDAHYPALLVLEMGVDAPGDMAYLVGLAPCETGVLTAIGASHLELLETVEGVLQEKRGLVDTLVGKKPCAVLNADDPLQMGIRDEIAAPVLTYGLSTKADVRAQEVVQALAFDPDVTGRLGISCTVSYRGERAVMAVDGVAGTHQLLPLLAAVAVGVHYGVPLQTCLDALRDYATPNGRMKLLPGIKGTLIVDDSYNSSPLAARAALDTLHEVEVVGGARRIAILGDMRELGEVADQAHRDLGAYVAKRGVDMLLVVGAYGAVVADAAVAAGMDRAKIWCFRDAQAAGLACQDMMRRGDVVLVKGSQNTIRLERAVREIMAEPLRAGELLCRQGREWQGR